MLLGPSSKYMVLYVHAPGIDCLNATQSILLPLEKKENIEDWRQGIITMIPTK